MALAPPHGVGRRETRCGSRAFPAVALSHRFDFMPRQFDRQRHDLGICAAVERRRDAIGGGNKGAVRNVRERAVTPGTECPSRQS
jgi:hypothetical protein